MSREIHAAIRQLLETNGVAFEEARHVPVYTVEDAASARGCPIEIGAKSIVLKTDSVFRLFVMSGATPMRSRLIRKRLGVRRTRFASANELLELTGIEPGAVPPFGEPILPLELFVDPALLEHGRIAFTPGVHTASILMSADDYVRLARPEIFRFTRAPDHQRSESP
jgi:Ala-tRNA(Pro) deacylase